MEPIRPRIGPLPGPGQTDDAARLMEQAIARSAQGDVWAFRHLVESHQQYAFSLAFRIIGDEDDAQDIVQEAFVRVWTHIGDFRPEAKFTTWLYRIVVNCAYDRLKAEKRRRFMFLSAEKVRENDRHPNDATPDADLENRELAARIKAVARKLPLKQRFVFVLRDLQDLSVGEVAEILEMSRESVKTNLHYARRHIRRRLRQMGIP